MKNYYVIAVIFLIVLTWYIARAYERMKYLVKYAHHDNAINRAYRLGFETCRMLFYAEDNDRPSPEDMEPLDEIDKAFCCPDNFKPTGKTFIGFNDKIWERCVCGNIRERKEQ